MAALLALALGAVAPMVRAQAPDKPLDVYVIDTEGGKSALYVTPTGQSLLLDAGNPGGRDTDRIMEAIHAAGITQLDYLLLTHYHVDHVGGVEALAQRIPIKNFVDHGPTVEPREQVQGFQQLWASLYAKGHHIVVKPGDRLPITGVDWRIVTSAGQVIKTPLPGGGQPNPECASFTPKDITNDPENAQSVGSVVMLGNFKLIDLGDLLWNKEQELMCPNNPIGTVDVYMVSHHGLDWSGSPTLVHALRPRVAIMNNGTRKGGSGTTFPTLESSPGLENLWLSHWSYTGGIEHNPAGVFIANVDDNQTIANILTAPPRGRGGFGGRRAGGPAAAPGGGAPTGVPPAAGPAAGAPGQGAPGAPDAGRAFGRGQGGPGGPGGGRRGGGFGGASTGHSPAYWIKVSAYPDGHFTVTNPRIDFTKTYEARTAR
jgi:beta-lactamase superfamily II metal-dependent hydrolase